MEINDTRIYRVLYVGNDEVGASSEKNNTASIFVKPYLSRYTYAGDFFETPEALENEMIAQATRLAYQQLCDGTASSQVIVHYLKLATAKEKIEQDILYKQSKLIDAKTEAIKDQKKSEKLYQDALNAFRTYSGQRQEVDEDEDIL